MNTGTSVPMLKVVHLELKDSKTLVKRLVLAITTQRKQTSLQGLKAKSTNSFTWEEVKAQRTRILVQELMMRKGTSGPMPKVVQLELEDSKTLVKRLVLDITALNERTPKRSLMLSPMCHKAVGKISRRILLMVLGPMMSTGI